MPARGLHPRGSADLAPGQAGRAVLRREWPPGAVSTGTAPCTKDTHTPRPALCSWHVAGVACMGGALLYLLPGEGEGHSSSALRRQPPGLPQDKSLRLLRAKALECISLVGMAVGRERFRTDAQGVMQYLASLQAQPLDADDPTHAYMLQVQGGGCHRGMSAVGGAQQRCRIQRSRCRCGGRRKGQGKGRERPWIAHGMGRRGCLPPEPPFCVAAI